MKISKSTVSCVFAVSILLPATVFAQALASLPVLAPGLHSQTLPRANQPTIHYAISIPRNYSPSARVPLILALHFGVGDGGSAGAGRDVVGILIGPALAALGAIIVAPDSMGGDWSSPENESAVNALLDMVLASYSVDTKKIAVPAMAWPDSYVVPCAHAARYCDRPRARRSTASCASAIPCRSSSLCAGASTKCRCCS